MKLDRVLTISGKVVPVSDERVVLGLSDPGRAQFTVEAAAGDVAAFSAVAFDLGYASDDSLQRLFFGFVESVTPIDSVHCKLFCRELAGVLRRPMPLNLRHPDLRDVLGAIGALTNLVFSAPAVDYCSTKIANFVCLGDGLQALDSVGRAFRVADFVFQQQGDGVIFVGSWADSRWAGKAVDVDVSFFDGQVSSGSARIAAVPVFRPGVVVNGKRVLGLEFSGNFMTLSW